MRWKGIPLAAWDCLTIWDGSGSRRPESRLCACRVVVSDAHGLMSALQLYASEIEDLFGIGCRFHCETAVLIHDVAAATHLYHIAQKAVNNAIKHGHANNILIRLFSGDREGTLIIKDDGVGIERPRAPHAGVGLHIMNYRAGMIGGQLDVHRGQPKGTTVVCRFPVSV